MYCNDQKVMGSIPGRVNLGVHSTRSYLNQKSYLNPKILLILYVERLIKELEKKVVS